MTLRDLRHAPVPSLRGNPAGRLRNGRLPNHSPNGSVELLTNKPEQPRIGDFTGDGRADAVAAIGATSGAGGGDVYIELYTGNDKRLGGFNPAATVRDADHAQILAMRIQNEAVEIDYDAYTMSPYHVFYRSVRITDRSRHLVVKRFATTGATHSGLWSDPKIKLGFRSLGGVRLGMTIALAGIAAGDTITAVGDGVWEARDQPDPYARTLRVSEKSRVYCMASTGSPKQVILAPHRLHVGDKVSAIIKAWGHRAVRLKASQPGEYPSYVGYRVVNGKDAIVYSFQKGTKRISVVSVGPKSMQSLGCF